MIGRPKQSFRRIGAVALLSAIAVLAGCATPANPDAMAVKHIATVRKNPQTLSVQVGGGSATSALGSAEISSEDLRAAIEKSVNQLALFKEVVHGKKGDYDLSVTVTRLDKPSFGASYTVELEAGWTLVRTSDNSVVMRRSIVSAYTATMGDELIAVTRLRVAVEGAARTNVQKGLQAIALLPL